MNGRLDSTIIKKLWKYLSPYRVALFFAVILLLISKSIEAFVPIYVGYLAQKIMNTISMGYEAQETLLQQITIGSLETIGLLIGSLFFYLCMLLIKGWIGQKAVFTLRTQVYSHIERLPLSYFDHHAIGQLMTRTIHDVDQIDQMFTESLVPIIGNGFLFLCIFFGICFIDIHIGILFACLMPLIIWCTYKFHNAQRKSYQKQRTILSTLNGFVQEHLMGASIVRSFGLQEQEKKHFDKINQEYCQSNLETVHQFALFIAVIDFFQMFMLILVFVTLMVLSPFTKDFQVGTFFTVSLYAAMIFRPLVDLAERYNVLQSAMAAAGKVFDILEIPTETSSASKNAPEPPLDDVQSIVFENVWFAYKEDHWILKGLSFTLNKGESIALVGITGSGKTTVIQLLMRFYDFHKGSIKINGIDIREYSLDSIRKQFSIVLQDPLIFSGTLADNISLYQSTISKKELNNAVDRANLRTYLNHYPAGLNHKLTERGGSLSIGEMQLVSLARAIAQKRPIFILDEATANIDSETERQIQDALEKILENKTALVIAHRLSTIKDVDRILVLHQGVLSESGTHQELIKKKGLYEELYRLQFLG